MQNRDALIIFVGLLLVLLSSQQVLAQTPIEGWDKAKFGMTPEEVKNAYKEEEEYYKDRYHQKLDYIEKRYAGDADDLEYHKKRHGEYEEFWEEKEECWSREDGGLGYPHRFSNSWLKVLLEEDSYRWSRWPIVFRFVNNKLFNVEISLGVGRLSLTIIGVLEQDVEERHEFNLKLLELKKALVSKYGDPFKKEEIEEESEKKGSTRTFQGV